MATNYDDVLKQLNDAGLCVTALETGRLVRCKVEGDREKRGWYMLHDLQTSNGDVLIVGSYGVWRGNDSNTLKVELRKRDSEFTQEQRDALKRRIREDQKRVQRERELSAERAAARAAAAWSRYLPEGESDYLDRKCVQGFGLRYTASNSAVVPLLDATGKIHGLQFLRTQKQAEEAKRPTKEFWPTGVATKGHFHLIGAPQSHGIILEAEGYATAATLHMATGHPVAVAFNAGNLAPVARTLKRRYRGARILVCADNDDLQKCRHCKSRVVLPIDPKLCPSCHQEHEAENAGLASAGAAALEVDGAIALPMFDDESARQAKFIDRGVKQTDYNDLHVSEGLHVVRAQIEARLSELAWSGKGAKKSANSSTGDGGDGKLRPLQSTDDLLRRYSLVYAHSGAVFDHDEHMLMSLSDMRDACIRKDVHRAWCESPERDIVRIREVGFDPGYEDPSITCNLWSGWPTKPKAGRCEKLLEMLWHMCSNDVDSKRLYDWVLKWLAYPIQHPGAKLKTTVVVHGPQGTGKNLFFESVMGIYGQYGDVIDQSAIEDKFNDWASRKLFMIADEVVARSEMWHIKNRLKTLITGKRIRINPKNFAAYWEANHLNLVFLSNEVMPVVLEEDDRRHCVIWTPPKREVEFYGAVLEEIRSGGIEALHDYLLNVDLGDFNSGTRPPMTEAKFKLIDQSLDSPSRFYYGLLDGSIGGIEPRPARSTHVFELYTHWCREFGYRAAAFNKFVVQMELKHKVLTERKRYEVDDKSVGPHAVMMMGTCEVPDHFRGRELLWLGNQITAFRAAMNDYKGTNS